MRGPPRPTRRLLAPAAIVGSAPDLEVVGSACDGADAVATVRVVLAALRAGAAGFLLKSVSREQLWGGIRAVAAGDALLAPSITRRLIERAAGTAAAG